MQATLSTNSSVFFGGNDLQGCVLSVDLVSVVRSLIAVLISVIIDIISVVVLPIGILGLIIISVIISR